MCGLFLGTYIASLIYALWFEIQSYENFFRSRNEIRRASEDRIKIWQHDVYGRFE